MAQIALTRNGQETIFAKHGKLSVSGIHMVDKNGEPVALKGISTHNLNNYPEYATKETMQFMADEWGMEIFRLAMYTGEADGFKGYADGDDANREHLEAIVKNCIRAAAELGIYALIDWHILFDYNPNMHKDSAKAFFDKMSAWCSEYDNVIYEICNEPNMDCTWAEIKSYAEEVIPIIRANDPDSVIVVGTPCWSQQVDEAAKDPLAFNNLLYTVHFYATTHKQWLRDKAEAAMAAGLGIFVTEYGICDASGNGDIDYEETDRWMDWMNKNHISCCLWNLSNKDESSAMISPECKKTIDFTEDDLSTCGKWFVKMMK